MFESVNTCTDGRTRARPVYYKLTSEPSAQVSLQEMVYHQGSEREDLDCIDVQADLPFVVRVGGGGGLGWM